MYFANPWGLLALISLPIIAYIHIFHRRYPPMEIAGLHLWGVVVNRQSAGRKKERLPLSQTLLLELLAALLMSLILAQPRFGETERVPHLIVVLDNSASMSAIRQTDQTSFRDASISTMKGRLEALGKKALITVLLTGRRPVMLAGPAVEWKEADKSLQTWHPNASHHSFASTIDLAKQLKSEATTILFLTDTPNPFGTPAQSNENATPNDVEVIALGEKLPNLAFTAASWTTIPGTNVGKIYTRIANFSAQENEVTLNMSRGGSAEIWQSKQLKIPAQNENVLEFPVPAGLKQLTLSLKSGKDALGLDSQLVLVEPQDQKLKVAVTFKADDPAFEAITRVLKLLPDLQLTDTEQADLIFANANSTPPKSTTKWWIGIGPITPGAGKDPPRDVLGPYVLNKRHPLLEGLTFGGVVSGGIVENDLNQTPLISVGTTSILGELNTSPGIAYVLNLNLARSNLTQSPDWPILVSNLVENCRNAQPGLHVWNYRSDEEIRFTLAPEVIDKDQEVELIHNGHSRPVIKTRIVELPTLEDPGFYQIKQGEDIIGNFAVNFYDRQESQLSGLGEYHLASKTPAQKQAFLLDDPLTIWVLIGLIFVVSVIVMDWFVLRPRQSTIMN
jgi:hypothetical protein